MNDQRPIPDEKENENDGIKTIKDAADTAMNALDSEFEDIENKFMRIPDFRHLWKLENYVPDG